jgi:hypothetical protein
VVPSCPFCPPRGLEDFFRLFFFLFLSVEGGLLLLELFKLSLLNKILTNAINNSKTVFVVAEMFLSDLIAALAFSIV